MEIGEQYLPLAEHFAFGGLGFLDLDNHVRLLPDLIGSGQNFRASVDVILIG